MSTSSRGFTFKGRKVQVQMAPQELREMPKPDEELLDKKPGVMTTAIRTMFAKPEKKEVSIEPLVKTETVVKDTLVKPVPTVFKKRVEPPLEDLSTTLEFEDVLERLENLILLEDKGNPYEVKTQKTYVPETRRGFANFIKETYDAFTLKPGAEPDTVSGDKYPYQRFVREYIRQSSPYRGILVYHGLGSGKTCTAIAASEALFSTAHKKIIVLTPFSLRKNFIKEITFCGFRHFRLQNYWIPLDKDNIIHRTFATEVLNVSTKHLKTAKHIWVPDFDQPTSNYKNLTSEQQTEIRAQIVSILVYDKVKNPTGRIRFINYNGILAHQLKDIACTDPTFFDNAVIVVDEIHNLIRLMQGTIEPYLSNMKGVKRKMSVETVDVDKWKPSLCETSRNYKRGYLFYRLLLQATNSKIIGLSGTPLINFPEELGILSNILHGYTTMIEGVISVSGSAMEKRIEALLHEYDYTDFVSVETDKSGGGIRVVCSLLPEGVIKISNDVGVRRLDPVEQQYTRKEILEHLSKTLESKGYKFSQPLSLYALPLLPPFGEEFASIFVDRSKGLIKNSVVLLKRLSGLISYYKGARQDRMPTVKKDVVVRVPMSTYQQNLYLLARSEEINKDKNKKESGGLDALWSEVYEIAGMKNSTSYRMTSRQVCNFAFPPQVKRPRANNIEDENIEAPDTKDIIDKLAENDNEFPEMAEDSYEEGVEESDELEESEDFEESDQTVQPVEKSVVPLSAVKTKLKSLKDIVAAKKAKQIDDCKTGQKAGESYRTAIERAKKCLVELTGDSLRLDNAEGLRIYSPKFATLLLNIQNTEGSSLVYSQFLDMEGIGIFRLVMDANGYAPLEIEATSTGFQFSKATELSLRKGSLQPRYITFSGAEKEEIRRLALDVFNANFNELPSNIKTVLLESGFENNNNKYGQICRVFCITSAGAEGLSLKNVRAVHIMEPYWNDVRLKQVKGRAIRIGSHLDLPERDRNVSCYTYITVFGEEAQMAKSGDLRIDETVRNKDSLERKESIEAHVPIPSGASTYVLTSDERLFVISERKKQIINELETLMKSAAVDCVLNYEENKDGTYKCLRLPGNVGDFLYHPDLITDIRESASMYQVEKRNLLKIRYKNTVYYVEESGEIFNVYAENETTKVIGTMPSKDGKPILPITFLI